MIMNMIMNEKIWLPYGQYSITLNGKCVIDVQIVKTCIILFLTKCQVFMSI